jgi:hypothetical protein
MAISNGDSCAQAVPDTLMHDDLKLKRGRLGPAMTRFDDHGMRARLERCTGAA